MYLSRKGYVVEKKLVNVAELKKELYARPLGDEKYSKVPGYPVYKETANYMYLPKMYGIQKYGFPSNNLESYNGVSVSLEFTGTLHERQNILVDKLHEACTTQHGGVLQAGTGIGKTVCALKVIQLLGGKTAVLVNKIPLMNQWKSEIKRFLPSAKVGTVQGKTVDVEGKDIILVMIQSVSRQEYPPQTFSDIRTLVVDEVHNLSSRVFSMILFQMTSKYTIGLSATPKRSDGCEYVFQWHLGEVVYKSTVKRGGLPVVIRTMKLESTEYRAVTDDKGNLQYTSMISELVAMKSRNECIVDTLAVILKQDNQRKVLILSERKSHLNTLVTLVKAKGIECGLFTGGMKQAVLDASRQCQVILATFAAFSEGVSEESLDTLMLVTPKKYIGHLKSQTGEVKGKQEKGVMVQVTGRILRKEHTDRNPLIIDFQDQFSVYTSQSRGRNVFYKMHFKDATFQTRQICLDEPIEPDRSEDNGHLEECLIE